VIPVSRPKIIVIALCVLVAAAASGWWVYGEHQKREQRKAIVALVTDSGARLRSALTAAAEGPEAARGLEEDAAAAERNFASLKAMDAARQQALADAADDYLLTGREILKRVVNVQRYRALLAESLQALSDHMRADDHTGAWVQQAVKARERANKDHRDLGLAAAALDQLLQSFSASQKKIAPYVEPAMLIDQGAIEAARTRTLATAKQADADIEKTRRPDAFR
jgi:hypothetical protein